MSSLNILPPPVEQQAYPRPTYRISNFGDYSCQSIFADTLESEGFSIKYDHDDEFIAVGCYNGTKMIYSVKEST